MGNNLEVGFYFLNLGHGLSFGLDGGCQGGGGAEQQEIDCSHPEGLENSPGLRTLGDEPAGLRLGKRRAAPSLPPSLSSLHLPHFLSPERKAAWGGLEGTLAW